MVSQDKALDIAAVMAFFLFSIKGQQQLVKGEWDPCSLDSVLVQLGSFVEHVNAVPR